MTEQSSNAHKRQLARWLHEWSIDRRLAVADPAPQTAIDPMPLAPGIPAAPGDIRLLHPVPTDDPHTDRPLYVLVLEQRDDGSFVVAPFGRFSEPATPGEWRTGLRPLPIRVLCLWNARTVSAALLSRSWKAGSVPASTLDAARKIRGGAATSATRVGPPLLHPLDPRHLYLADEAAFVEAHLAALVPAAGLVYEDSASTLLKAAEPPAPYGKPGPRRRKRRGQQGSESVNR